MKEKIIRQESGRVISSSRDKTITVLIERKVKHPMYKKILRRSSKIHAHDENNESTAGDLVTIQECRPISKSKSWKLVNVIEKNIELSKIKSDSSLDDASLEDDTRTNILRSC